MTEEEERRALLHQIATHTDLDFNATSLDRLRWVARRLEVGARIVREKGRMAAMCYAEMDDEDET